MVLRSYLPILIFIVLSTSVGALFVYANSRLGPRFRRRPTTFTEDAYECGLPSEVQSGFRFGISFYLIAILFLLFDIEVVFLYPIAVELQAFGTFALIEAGVFIGLLLIALIYVWRRGALEWK